MTTLNWYFGWALIASAFGTGAIIGLFFHREDFFGGYGSFRRRLLRLGHIAQAALGMMNVLFSVSTPTTGLLETQIASWAFIIGGIAMPTVCFLTAWKKPFRHLFFIPVVALFIGVIQTLQNGPP
ncbi:hypothetical protein CA13_37520 [Planctomycetes bacterium CA13]|uniref:Uncharacterized protein n=1 Tax=Novipirellula herctigrandis TaxID=2527986 RepID=A0A5C5Z515_9BACT|nr:hypothetical protein CA13_37520 [Planctomycetes bacterium CA13]